MSHLNSGNMHGMPVAALLDLRGMRHAPGFKSGQFACGLKPHRVAYIGLRDVDPGEKWLLRKLNMERASFYAEDVERLGMADVVRRALDAVNPNRSRPVHLSFDVDGIDPTDIPSTGTPVPKGPRLHEALEAVRFLRETGLLVSMDVVSV